MTFEKLPKIFATCGLMLFSPSASLGEETTLTLEFESAAPIRESAYAFNSNLLMLTAQQLELFRKIGREYDLPAYSISVIGSDSLIEKATRVDRETSGNLFPVRPHLTLWYPPYARKQPRVSAEGVYEVDFSAFADKKSAVIKMDLSGIEPKEGKVYQVSFEVQAKSGLGFVARLPDAAAKEGTWLQLGPQFAKQNFEFVYSPEANDGELSFFFAENAVAAGAILTLRQVSVVEIE